MLFKISTERGWGGPDVLKTWVICTRKCWGKKEAGVQERTGMIRHPPRAVELQEGLHSAAGRQP